MKWTTRLFVLVMGLPFGVALADDFNPAKEIVKQQLIDPDSAKFQNLRMAINSKGEKSVCGEVNSRNRMGGYAGAKSFAVIKNQVVVFEDVGMPNREYQLSGCAGPNAELITRLNDEAKFNCSVAWTMITNTLIDGETPDSAVNIAIRATVNHAKENGLNTGR